MPKHLKVVLLTVVLLASVLPAAAAAAPTFYNNRAAFQAALSSSFTDDYENPAYQFIQNDAQMTAVNHETRYMSTGFLNLDIVFNDQGNNHSYCAGCNGSFELFFDNTTFGGSNGVFGVGLDVVDVNDGYTAYITFGDNTTMNVLLPPAGSFFGVTDTTGIKSICFGLPNCGTTTSLSFAMDNLTIGSGGATTPEPTTLLTFGSGLFAVAGVLRRKLRG